VDVRCEVLEGGGEEAHDVLAQEALVGHRRVRHFCRVPQWRGDLTRSDALNREKSKSICICLLF
jgi:hypothetical protein